MSNSDELRRIIECCSNPDCDTYDEAWTEFVHLYDGKMRSFVRMRLSTYSVGNPGQFADLIVSDVYERLRVHLGKFDTKTRINKFDSWLLTVANRVISGHFRVQYNKIFLQDGTNIIDITKSRDPNPDEFEVTEYFMTHVRRVLMGKTSPEKLERDIYVAYLVLIKGLDPDTCWAHPCFRSGMRKCAAVKADDNPAKERERQRHYIEVLINRIRSSLKKDPEFLRGLNER